MDSNTNTLPQAVERPALRSGVWFGVLYVVAILRSLRYRFPRSAPLPQWHTGVSCSLHRPGECWSMYLLGWKPWCISLATPRRGQFAVEMSEAEKAMEQAWLSSPNQ